MEIRTKIKLVATDMDGTLLNSRKERPADFDSWVLAHPDIKIVIASGRQYYALLKQFGDTASRLVLIAEDGGLVFSEGRLLFSNSMDTNDVKHCIGIAEKLPGAAVVLCGVRSAVMKHASPAVENEVHLYFERLSFTEDLYKAAEEDDIVKIELYFEKGGAEKILSEMPVLPAGLKTVLPDKSWIAIENETVSKGSALRQIITSFGLSPDECMAFGDYLNDTEMLRAVTHSFAMKNAHPHLKEIAMHVAASNDEEGVMQELRKL